MSLAVLSKENIKLQAQVKDKEEAIRLTGSLLVQNGYVQEAYIEKMLEREELATTYMGNGVAIPHGTEEAKQAVLSSGVVIVQVPEGVDFGAGNRATLLIGIAGKNDEHLDILSKIAIVCSEEENVEKLVQAQSPEEILELFGGVDAF